MRIPPQNVDAERKVLGGILIRSTALAPCLEVGLRPDSFHDPRHAAIYAAMIELEQRSRPIDVVTLEDHLRTSGEIRRVPEGAAFFAELMAEVPTAENIEHWARIVHEKALLRRLIAACAQVQGDAYVEAGDVAQFLDRAEASIFAVSQDSDRRSYEALPALIKQTIDDLQVRYDEKRKVTGVPTGFADVDEKTAGLQPADLIVLAARPSMGKTALALNMARNAAVDGQVPVLVFSLEMSRESLVERLICAEARVDSSRMRSGYLSGDDWARITDAASRLYQAPIFIDDSGAPTVLEIRAKARRFRADPKIFAEASLGLIVVDYLQLIRGPGGGGGDSREREISEVSRSLKALAKELRLPVVALSQLNRKLEAREDKRPQLSDLRESGAIEQDADLIAFIYRDEYYNRESEARGVAEVIIGKQRRGPTGTVELAFRPEFTRFDNLSRREEP